MRAPDARQTAVRHVPDADTRGRSAGARDGGWRARDNMSQLAGGDHANLRMFSDPGTYPLDGAATGAEVVPVRARAAMR